MENFGYGNMRIKNLSRPWSYYVRVPKLVNTGSATTAVVGYMDTAAPAATGSVYVSKAGGLTASTNYGTLIFTYYIHAFLRK